MKINRQILGFVLVGVLGLMQGRSAQAQAAPIPRFLDTDVRTKCQEIQSETEHFRAVVRAMVAIVDSAEADPEVKQMAASALRDFRAVEAIPVLVRNLTSVTEIIGGGRNMVPGIQSYTCALALYDIGPKAVDPLIWFIRGDADSKQVEVAACTISAILGKKRAVTTLRANVEENVSDEIRQRLYEAVKAIEALP